MSLFLRLVALLGSPAHAVNRVTARLLPFLSSRLPGALILAALLGIAAWASAQDTDRAIAARPQPIETSVGELVDSSTSAWVAVSGLLSGPHLDNGIYASDQDTHFLRISDDPHDHVRPPGQEPLVEPGPRQTTFRLTQGDGVTRWFYVLREASGDRALVVRSARDGNAIRLRSVVVAPEGRVDGIPRLVELADAGSDPPSAPVDEADGRGRVTIRATFGDAAEMSCDTGDECPSGRTWRYLVTDAAHPDQQAWVDSQHPPDALPVTLTGVVATDAARMEVVVGTDEMAGALDGLRYPDDLVLADGIGPVLTDASYLGAMLLAICGVLLVLSAAIPYPVFRPLSRRAVDLPRPVVDELIGADAHGVLPGVGGAERVSGAPARIGWLPSNELARRAWHLRRDIPAPGDDRPRLALLAVEGSFVLPLETIRDRLRIEPGLVATNRGVQHALRLVGPGIRTVLGFASEADRDRIHTELDGQTDAPPVGPIPVAPRRRPAASRPWARMATAVSLATAAVVMVIGSAVGVLWSGASPVEAVLTTLAAAVVGTLALGIGAGHRLADEMLPSVALVGVIVAGVAAAASIGCGTWLTPNLAGCAEFAPVRLVAPLVALVAFCLSLWATPHLGIRQAG
jgi:hypothetical protein